MTMSIGVQRRRPWTRQESSASGNCPQRRARDDMTPTVGCGGRFEKRPDPGPARSAAAYYRAGCASLCRRGYFGADR